MNITDLVAKIEAANEAYRNNKSTMADEEFDALEDKLRKLDPNHPWFDKTGAPPPVDGSWPKVRHEILMRSLCKAQTDADMQAWCAKHANQQCVITEKLDGISIALKYDEDGKLVQALTRGDGEVGEDITRNVLLMQVPLTISAQDFTNVRAEIICPRSAFFEHFDFEDSNPRNTAAGTAKRQSDPEKCKHLVVVAYQYLPLGEALLSKEQELLALRKEGFAVPNWSLVDGSIANGSIRKRQEYIDDTRESLDYDIDGLVVEVNDRDFREGMGEKNKRPDGARAFKFPHEQEETTLRKVIPQVGRSGVITPVAEFDVVKLAGAKVRRASLYNYGRIAVLAADIGQKVLSEGDRIIVSRRNDVIPCVESVVKGTDSPLAGFFPPENCPECGSYLRMDGAFLVCPNTFECPAQISGAVKRWVAKLGIKFLGEGLIDALCDQGFVTGIADLYGLDPEEVAELEMTGRKVGGSAERGFTSLFANMDLPLHVFIGSLGIPMIGRSMAKTIVDGGFDTLEKMAMAGTDDLSALGKMGGKKARSFVEGLASLEDRGVLDDLMTVGITIQAPATGVFKGVSVCFSGVRDKVLERAIESQGGTVKTSVGKTLGYLVAKDVTSTTGKPKKARQYGVNIIGVEDMWDKLGGRPA